MFKRRNYVILVLIMSATLSSLLSAQESPPANAIEVGGESFPISGDLQGCNDHAAMTSSFLTGDIVVVWANIEEDQAGSYVKSTIYAKLFRKLKTGKFKAAKALVVSDKSGVNIFPDIDHCPGADSYLVTWHDYRGDGTSDIYCRKLNSKAKVVGPVKKLTNDGMANGYAKVKTYSEETYVPPGTGPLFIIFFDKQAANYHAPDSKAGLYSVGVDTSGNEMWFASLEDKSQELIDSPGDYGYIRPTYVIRSHEDWGFYVLVAKETKYNIPSAWVYKFDTAAMFVAKKQLAEAESEPTGLLMLTNNLLYATYCTLDKKFRVTTYAQKLKTGNLGFKGKAVKTMEEYITDTNSNVIRLGSYNKPLAFGWNGGDQGFYCWDITSKGKELPKTASKLFNYWGNLDTFLVHSSGGLSPEVFVVWHHTTWDSDGALWGNLVKAREPDSN